MPCTITYFKRLESNIINFLLLLHLFLQSSVILQQIQKQDQPRHAFNYKLPIVTNIILVLIQTSSTKINLKFLSKKVLITIKKIIKLIHLQRFCLFH